LFQLFYIKQIFHLTKFLKSEKKVIYGGQQLRWTHGLKAFKEKIYFSSDFAMSCLKY